MKRRAVLFTPALLLVIAHAFAAHTALAADPPAPPSDPAAAQALFYEARALMQQNKYAEACPKLEESLRLDAGIGTQFNLADCNEHLGKITTAWAGFLEVAAQAKLSNQTERERVARKRAAAVEPRLAKLVIDGTIATDGVQIKRDGVVLGAAALGAAIPVDPGTHKITASAPGKQTWEATIACAEGKTARISVPRELAPAPVVLTAPPKAYPVTSATVPATATPVQEFPAPIVEGRGATQRTAGWIVTTAGLVGVGVGAGFGLSSLSKRNESRDHCVAEGCDARGLSLRDDAMRSGNIATIATLAGAGALVGGLVLVLTAPSGQPEPRSSEASAWLRARPRDGTSSVRVTPAAGPGGFALDGVF